MALEHFQITPSVDLVQSGFGQGPVLVFRQQDHIAIMLAKAARPAARAIKFG